jgi:NADPH2:quinone reductase
MKAIRVENPGSGYQLVVGDIPRPVARPGEVLIKVAAAGLNRADIAQAMGQYPPPPGAPETLGMEVSGEIVEVGAAYGTSYRRQSLRAGAGRRLCRILRCIIALRAAGSCRRGSRRRLRPAGSAFHRVDQSDGFGAAAAGRKRSHSWRIERHRHGRDPAVRDARPHGVRDGGKRKDKCAACEKLGAARASTIAREDFVERDEGGDRDKGVDVILDMVGGDYIERNFRALARGRADS